MEQELNEKSGDATSPKRPRASKGRPIKCDPPVEHATSESSCVILDALLLGSHAKRPFDVDFVDDEVPVPEGGRPLRESERWFAIQSVDSGLAGVCPMSVCKLGDAPIGVDILIDHETPHQNRKWIRTRVVGESASLRVASIGPGVLAFIAGKIGAVAGAVPVVTSTTADGRRWFDILGQHVNASGFTTLHESVARGAKHAVVEMVDGAWFFVTFPIAPQPPARDQGSVNEHLSTRGAPNAAPAFVASAQGGAYHSTLGHHPSHAR